VVVPRYNRLLGMSRLAPVAGHDVTPSIYVGVPLLVLFVLVAVFHWSNRLVRLLVPLYHGHLPACPRPQAAESTANRSLPCRGVTSGACAAGQRRIPAAHGLRPTGPRAPPGALARHVTRAKVALAARWGLAALSLAAIFANVPTFASVVNPGKPRPSAWVQALPSQPLTDLIPSFFTDGTYRKYIKPGENVVIVSHRGNAGMMFQAYTGFYFKHRGWLHQRVVLSRGCPARSRRGPLPPPRQGRQAAGQGLPRLR